MAVIVERFRVQAGYIDRDGRCRASVIELDRREQADALVLRKQFEPLPSGWRRRFVTLCSATFELNGSSQRWGTWIEVKSWEALPGPREAVPEAASASECRAGHHGPERTIEGLSEPSRGSSEDQRDAHGSS